MIRAVALIVCSIASGSASADGTINLGAASVTISSTPTISPNPGHVPGTDMPDTPFFREVARERQCIKPDAPLPLRSDAQWVCPSGWSYAANPGHCEPVGCDKTAAAPTFEGVNRPTLSAIPDATSNDVWQPVKIIEQPPLPAKYGSCVTIDTNPPIYGPCDNMLAVPMPQNMFPAAGIKDPSAPPEVMPEDIQKHTDRTLAEVQRKIDAMPQAVTPHHYTLNEIDRMRAAVIARWIAAHLCAPGGTMICAILPEEVEAQLNTYMSQGITPEELEAKAARP
jgi:hypothetical protein